MLMGEFQHNIDPKGRLIMPAKFRDELGDIFILTKGLDGCLFVYPMKEWKEIEQKLRSLPLTKADARAFTRFFFSGASEGELDKQGRVSVPTNLREYASLEKEVVVVGVGNRLEIWSSEKWDNYNDDHASSYEGLAEKMLEFGINF